MCEKNVFCFVLLFAIVVSVCVVRTVRRTHPFFLFANWYFFTFPFDFIFVLHLIGVSDFVMTIIILLGIWNAANGNGNERKQWKEETEMNGDE